MSGARRLSKSRDKSPSSTPVPTTEQPNDASEVSDAEWQAMTTILNAIYDYRTEDGYDPSNLFQRLINKRVIPEYYETIKEPMALSTIKQKINKKRYTNFSEFVRDFALIPYNAQVFNIPDSQAFQDALVVKEQLEKHLQMLVKDGFITQEVATLPYIGEIPTYEAPPPKPAAEAEAEGDDDEESDDEADDDDDEDGDEDEDGKKKKRRARASKRDGGDEDGGKRHRGRPPKLLTPMEARMQTILKGIRKPKNNKSVLLIKSFDKLPDKAVMPEYYAEIKNPMAYDQLKRKVKRKKYKTLEEFMADVNLMFNNAKQYNTDDSQIYKDASQLQKEAQRLYDEERAKPDDEFADDEGKIPLPNGILHNGELYKVGDWVHIQNLNDLTKPIPAQVYRTYKAANGQTMVNVCWYYRPEQTVHRFDKHFFSNEVVKTGRYRDHQIEEVEGKCFIMFYTRFFKGRPRGIAEGTEVYVCQARYNETAHQFNTIKTWASCLPDEVRDKDYEMDLFDQPRKMKKFPTPIAYLLKDEQKETDDFPKVQWGAEGAPPKVGAVHRRPRNEKDSPPPEPTPPPPPKQPTPPPRQFPPTPTPAAPQQSSRPAAMTQNYSTYRPYTGPPNVNTPAASRPPTSSSYPAPATPQHQSIPPRPVPPASSASYQQPSSHTVPPNPNTFVPRPPTANYREPPTPEVFHLPDAANLSIPAEIRERYQQDESGRVLFFTTPPVHVDRTGTARGHSVRYLAEKARRAEATAKKRKERDKQRDLEAREVKKIRLDSAEKTANTIEGLKRKALDVLCTQLATSTTGQLGDHELSILSEAQKATLARNRTREENERKRAAMRSVTLGSSFFADDWDSRIVQ